MFLAASSAGIAAVFGAPFGGVLFAVEAVSTYYLVNNYWKGVFTALFGSLFFYVARLLHLSSGVDDVYLKLLQTQFDPLPFSIAEYASFVALGIVCGVCGAFFITMTTWFWKLRQSIKILRRGYYIPVLAVAFLTAAVSFPGAPFLNASNIEAISLLFSTGAITYVQNPLMHLSVFVCAKSLLTCAALVLPIPSGVFTPSFIIGGGLGRFVGEFIKYYIFPNLSTAAGFAVVGAAAFNTAVTRKISMAVIIFEITGQLTYLLPVMIATVTSIFVANLFNFGFYDKMIELKKLPFLGDIKHAKSKRKIASQVMRSNFEYVTTVCDVKTLASMLKRTDYTVYPLVDNEKDMTFIGQVARSQLIDALEQKVKMHMIKKEQEMQDMNSGMASAVSSGSPVMIEGADVIEDDDANYNATNSPRADENASGSFSAVSRRNCIIFNEKTIKIDNSPIMITAKTSIPKVHFLFTMLAMRYMYVVERGKLVGVLTKKDLIQLKL